MQVIESIPLYGNSIRLEYPRAFSYTLLDAYKMLTIGQAHASVSGIDWKVGAMPKLTMLAVKAMEVPEAGQAFLWDSELRGFGIRAIPSGLKTFVLQFRNAEGRSRRIVLGRLGVITVDQARGSAKIKLGELAKGHDPAEDLGPREKITIAEACDWYLAEAGSGRLLGRRNQPIKASTLVVDRSSIAIHIKPLIGGRQVRALRAVDIAAMQADIAAGTTAKARKSGRGGATLGGPGAASRATAILKSVLSHAKRMDVVPSNPALGVRKISTKKRDRRLSIEEIQALGDAMRRSVSWKESPVALAAVRLMLLTGFRISEAQGLRREWVDIEKGCVRFPDTKSGAQVRVLGSAVVASLSKMQAPIGSPYVFPADYGDGCYTAAKRCLSRLCVAANIGGVTPHTLRHTFGSVAGDLGFSELTIAALLGHSARGVTQGYVHIDQALKLAADRTSAEIASHLKIVE